MKTILTALSVLTLIFLDRASAISGLTIDGYAIEFVATDTDSTSSNIAFYPTGAPTNFAVGHNAVNTAVVAGSAIAVVADDYHYIVVGQMDNLQAGAASSRSLSQLYFDLTEAVDYSLSGSLTQSIAAGSGSTAELSVRLYDRNTLVDVFSQSLVGNATGSDFFIAPTGTLAAGEYFLIGLSELLGTGGQASSRIDFFLTSRDVVTPPGGGNNVPDAGSTMLLFSMGLAAIGGIRYKLS